MVELLEHVDSGDGGGGYLVMERLDYTLAQVVSYDVLFMRWNAHEI